jgi:hypothetical protein
VCVNPSLWKSEALRLKPWYGKRPARRATDGIPYAGTNRNMGILLRYARRTSNCKSVITLICSIAWFTFAGLADTSGTKLDSPTGLSSNSLPSKIITTDGKVYNEVKLSSVQPDGLLVEYQPASGGIGLAKLKFAMLSESLQKQFGYDPLKASAFEQQESLAAFRLSHKLQRDEGTQNAVLNNMSQRPNLIRGVSVSSSDPTVTYTYNTPNQQAAAYFEGYSDCKPDYQCDVEFDLQAKSSVTGPPFRFQIDAVRISLGLSCHITEPKIPYDYIRIEQEERRKIYEYFYRFAPQVARRIGESMIDKQFFSRETDFETAEKGILSQEETLFKRRYSIQLGSVAQRAVQYYEKLTEHGRNSFDRDKAVQEAIAKYGDEIGLQPSRPSQLRAPSNPGVRPSTSQAITFSPN